MRRFAAARALAERPRRTLTETVSVNGGSGSGSGSPSSGASPSAGGGASSLIARCEVSLGARTRPRRGQRQLTTKKTKTHACRAPQKACLGKKSLSANQRPASSNRPTREPVRGRTRATWPVFKHPTTARRTPHRRQNGRCHQRLHRRARRRPQGASRFRVDRSRERRARVSGEDHGRTSHPARACQHPNLACRTYLTPSAAPLLHPQRVAARRTFFGKGVAGLAPVRYV